MQTNTVKKHKKRKKLSFPQQNWMKLSESLSFDVYNMHAKAGKWVFRAPECSLKRGVHILPSEKQDHSIKKYWFLNFSKLVGIIIICLYKSCKRLQPVQFCHLQQHLFRFLLQIVSFSCAFYFTKITRAVFHFLTPFSCSYLNLTVASMYACEL